MITLQTQPKISAAPAPANAGAPAAANAGAPAPDDAAAGLPGFASLLAGLQASAGDAPDASIKPSSDDEDAPALAAAPIETATGEVQAAIAMVALIAPAPADKVAGPATTPVADLQLRAVSREPGDPLAPLRADSSGTASQERTRADAVAPEAALASHGLAGDAAFGAAQRSALAREPAALAREPAALTDIVPAAEHAVQAAGTPTLQLAAFAQHYSAEPVSRPASVDAPIGSARWGEQLATQVVIVVRDGTQAADIQVTPPELGPVRARISIDNGVATVMLSTSAPETRDALEAALPALRDVLAESGIRLGESAVSEERFAQQRESRFGVPDRESALANDQPGDAAGGIPSERRIRVGLLDLYA